MRTSRFCVSTVYCEPNPQARTCMHRPRHGRWPCRVDWRQPSNLDAAFAASASTTGRDSLFLAPETFRYEVDPTCGGILGGSFTGAEDGGLRSPVPSSLGTYGELYSPAALSFVSPVVDVPWPVGVLLPTGVLRTYRSIHRSLFRHQLVLHRLRRLRVAFRELDAAINAWAGGRRRGVRGGASGDGTGVSWDAGRLHWMHLFRHEMQHMADSLQVRAIRYTRQTCAKAGLALPAGNPKRVYALNSGCA